MIDIGMKITGDQIVATRFRLMALDSGVRADLVKDMTRLAILLQRYVKTEKLSGDPLKVKTGTLRRSITYKIDQRPGIIEATVGTKVKYGAAHEFGFDGMVTVREHMLMVKKAWGREVKNPMQHPVRSFSRHMVLPEKSFLRSALRELEPQIVQGLRVAIDRAVGGSL